jgi:CBS domain-containing protein
MNTPRRVKDVMNPDVMTVGDEMTTDELARYLTEHEISGAPVVDGQGHLIGVVSMTDIARYLADADSTPSQRHEFYRDTTVELLEDLPEQYDEERAATVREVMTPVIHQVPVTATLAEAARIMIREHVHRLVVTQGKQPVGIVTSMDLLRVIAEPS